LHSWGVVARILVIDDDLGWRELYGLELGDAHEILQTADPIEGLDYVYAFAPDLLILDCQMPEMSGPELLATLRTRGIRVPVILCTANPSQVRDVKCDGVVAKTTDLRRLRRTIDRVLAERDSRRHGRAA
jgi:CheY-like chemotaxis protein